MNPRHWYHIRNAKGENVARVRDPEDAAAFVSFLGAGATVREPGSLLVLWEEGRERQPAGESFDFAADTIAEREHSTLQKRREEERAAARFRRLDAQARAGAGREAMPRTAHDRLPGEGF